MGAVAAVAVAGLLVSVRDWLGASNVALILAIVVVAAAMFGGLAAGVLTSLVAALSFDYFHTQPFYDLRIDDRENIITAVLLLILGLAVGELAALRERSRREMALHARGASRLEDVASAVAAGADLDEVWPIVRKALTEQLPLSECRFEPAPFVGVLTELERKGQLGGRELHWVPGGFELPEPGVQVPVVHEGRLLGRLVLVPDGHRATTPSQRRVAVGLADQLAVAAAHSLPLRPLD
jgi:hypothetical protein